jgi:hypothetical protein
MIAVIHAINSGLVLIAAAVVVKARLSIGNALSTGARLQI